MAELNSFLGSVTGASGSVNALEAKSGWFVYVCERGAHAAAASTGTLITFDVAAEASRFDANDWVQVGTNTAKIVQVSAVGGNSISVGAAVTVFENDRIFNLGTTQPTVANGNATYSPNAVIYERSDDASDRVANSKLTTDANGGYQIFAADGFYDAIIQDANTSNQGSIVDLSVGPATTGHLLPATNNTYDLGSSTRNWKDIYVAGSFISGVSDASGDTVFDFRNATGLTQGNLFEMSMNDVTLISGDTHGGIFNSYSLPQVFNVKSARFGAKGDNSTDDSAAIAAGITAAFASANGTNGGIVYFPRGTYITTTQILVPSRVRLVGEGRRSTVIKADSTFPADGGANSALIRLGDADNNAFESTVEHMHLDCNQISGSIGIYSTRANEGSGPRDVIISNFESAGIFYDGASIQTTFMREIELFHTNATATGVSFNSISNNNVITDITTTSNNATQSSNPGIGVTGCQVTVNKFHPEYHDTGLYVGINGSGKAEDVYGHSTIDNLIKIDSPGFLMENLVASGATNLIWDNANGVTITATNSNAGGWYYASNDVAVGGTRSIWTSSTDGTNQVNPNTVFGGTVSFAAPVIVADRITSVASEDMASATTISITKNFVRLTSDGGDVQTINIDSAAPGAAHNGYKVTIVNRSTTQIDFVTGGNILSAIATTPPLTTADNEAVTFIWDNAESMWTPIWAG